MPTSDKRVSRRALLAGAVAGATGGVAGAALGYRFRVDVGALKSTLSARPLIAPSGLDEFPGEARRIAARHRQQTVATVAALKRKYERPVLGPTRMWDLVLLLAQCIDPADRSLCCASQLVHVQQILAAMEANRVEDPDLLVAAILHDVGKVALLGDELPENVVCSAGRIGEYDEGVGLDAVVHQFGHGELIHMRVKDLVPDHLGWLVRYHNIDLRDAARFMDARDREYATKYLVPFQAFDGAFRSPYFRPKIRMARYRELVEQYFPRPLSF